MTIKETALETALVFVLIAFSTFVGAVLALGVASLFALNKAPANLGAQDINVLSDIPNTSATVFVGKDISTQVVATSSSRTYLEIANNSGATSTPQALYCNAGAAAVQHAGFVVQASSSKVFTLDNMPRSAINCRYLTGTSSVAVFEY